ncbi:uncharacterized protein A1O9_08317 [Exophiala aquamarina CBS 119918]|uniref:Major facilitator superfamily (MFS) profile domain-containing protein n=1 Tax=Exophiala aquamarina CBS 119918 TaxID=1182545 RepID=A0A072P765_9EURO|nr:uncharacterized protein A1O9_08317 [Exophiala aquamarina CBS 119918]KEF55567.1 hypothetical protein A1O9_08317 [Exophiala aquamarina CBS 119918]
MLTTVNVYQAEIAPPHLRGTLVAFQIGTLNVAGALASWVGYAWDSLSPYNALPALMLIAGCFYIHFSPRWLMSKDQHAEAQQILQRLHDDHEDPTFWENEHLQISAQIAAEHQEQVNGKWHHMFTSAKEFRRVATAVAAMTSVPANGAQTIQVYQAVFYAGLGFSTRGTLLMAGIFGICNTAGGVTNLFLIDRTGRRKLFLSGLLILSVWLGVFAACSSKYAQTGLTTWGKAGISFVMVYIYCFGATFAASPYAYATEVLPTKIRAQGMALALFAANAVMLTFSQTAPIALKKIGRKFKFVFIASNIFFFVVVFFFFPEVSGSFFADELILS